MLGGGGVVPGGGYAASGGWCCADVVSSRTGLVLFDVLFNYEALLRSDLGPFGTAGCACTDAEPLAQVREAVGGDWRAAVRRVRAQWLSFAPASQKAHLPLQVPL